MAKTGAINLRDAADKIEIDLPQISQRAIAQLREMHEILPYVFDSMAGYLANGTDFPGGATSGFKRLDEALIAVNGVVGR